MLSFSFSAMKKSEYPFHLLCNDIVENTLISTDWQVWKKSPAGQHFSCRSLWRWDTGVKIC